MTLASGCRLACREGEALLLPSDSPLPARMPNFACRPQKDSCKLIIPNSLQDVYGSGNWAFGGGWLG